MGIGVHGKKMTFKCVGKSLIAILLVLLLGMLLSCSKTNGSVVKIKIGDKEITATPVYDNNKILQSIEIKSIDETMQTINLPGGISDEVVNGHGIYTFDVTFDGNEDIIVPAEHTANGSYYYAYVWDNITGEFVYSPGFEGIPNFALNDSDKIVLSRCLNDGGRSVYSIYSFNAVKKDFFLSEYLTYYPAAENDTYIFKVVVLENGEENITNEYTFSGGDIALIAKVDPNIGKYFETNSKWDLNSEKWQPTISD